MLTYVLDVRDLSDVRFVLAPLNETALSLFHLNAEHPHTAHLHRWRANAQAQRDLSVKPAEMGALVLRPASKESPAQIGCSKQNKCENGPKPRSNEGKTKAWIILMGLSN